MERKILWASALILCDKIHIEMGKNAKSKMTFVYITCNFYCLKVTLATTDFNNSKLF